MSNSDARNPLILELFADPVKFTERARSYALLKEYFRGLSLETLKPLLSDENILVKRAAAFVASELGAKAAPLLDDVIPLLESGNRYLVYKALEVVVVCAIGEYADRFIRIPQALECDDEVIRLLAMELIFRSSSSQTQAAARMANCDVHRRGLELLSALDERSVKELRSALKSENLLVRMYAAIAAKRLQDRHPDLEQQIVRDESDSVVRRFAEEFL